ncbi:class I SAM-dependent methyltransferase [Gemmatimonadota bacterium]
MLRKERTCQICGSDEQLAYLRARDFQVSKNWFDIVKCVQCGFVFTNPRPKPTDMNGYYSQRYYAYRPPTSVPALDQPRIGLTVLDVGCGSGSYLVSMHNDGYDTYGIEIDDKCIEIASSIGLDVRKPLPDGSFNFEDDFFDILNASHVLEHVPDLQLFLSEARRVMKTNAILRIEVPNIDSFNAHLLGSSWRHLDVPRHLSHFNGDTLRQLLEQHRFEVVKIETKNLSFFHRKFIGSVYTTFNLIQYESDHIQPIKLFRALAYITYILIRIGLHKKSTTDGSMLQIVARKQAS